MILGLVGTSAFGKEEVASFLISKGFSYINPNEIIETELKDNNIPITKNAFHLRKNQIEKQGIASWIESIRLRFQHGENFVIDNIFFVEETAELKKRKDFFLIGIYLPLEMRYFKALIEQEKETIKTEEEIQEVMDDDLEKEQQCRLMQTVDFSIIDDSIENVCSALTEILKKLNY